MTVIRTLCGTLQMSCLMQITLDYANILSRDLFDFTKTRQSLLYTLISSSSSLSFPCWPWPVLWHNYPGNRSLRRKEQEMISQYLPFGNFGLSDPMSALGTTVVNVSFGTPCWIAVEAIVSNTYQNLLTFFFV